MTTKTKELLGLFAIVAGCVLFFFLIGHFYRPTKRISDCVEEELSYFYIPETDTYVLIQDNIEARVIQFSKYLGNLAVSGYGGRNTRIYTDKETSISLLIFEQKNIIGAHEKLRDEIKVIPIYGFFFWIPDSFPASTISRFISVRFPLKEGELLYMDYDGVEHIAIPVTEEEVAFAKQDNRGICYADSFPDTLFPFQNTSESILSQLSVLEGGNGFIYNHDTVVCSPGITHDGYYEHLHFYIHPNLPDFIFYHSYYLGSVQCKDPSFVLVYMPHEGFDKMNDVSTLPYRLVFPWVRISVEKTPNKCFGFKRGGKYEVTIQQGT